MDSEKSHKLSLFPLPLLTDTKKPYRSFAEFYGSQPSEKDPPSLQQSGDPDAIEAGTKHKESSEQSSLLRMF